MNTDNRKNETDVKVGERFLRFDAGMLGFEEEAEWWRVCYRRLDGSEYEVNELRHIPDDSSSQ